MVVVGIRVRLVLPRWICIFSSRIKVVIVLHVFFFLLSVCGFVWVFD